MDIIDLRDCAFKNLRLDSGVRRRDGFKASFLLVIPAEAGIQWCKRLRLMYIQLWPY
jgi:hypothetical protein